MAKLKILVQEIEDYYIQLGYTGEKLRKALEKDKEYNKLNKKRIVKGFEFKDSYGAYLSNL